MNICLGQCLLLLFPSTDSKMLRSLGTSSNGDSGGNDDLAEPERGPTHHGRVEEKAPGKVCTVEKVEKRAYMLSRVEEG